MSNRFDVSNILESLLKKHIEYCFFEEQLKEIAAQCKQKGVSFYYIPNYDEMQEVSYYELIPIKRVQQEDDLESVCLSLKEYKKQRDNWVKDCHPNTAISSISKK